MSSIEITPKLLRKLRKRAELAFGPVAGSYLELAYIEIDFHKAANPAVVLALVAEVERLREGRSEKKAEETWFCLVDTQTGERMTDENGRARLFSSKHAQSMMLNDRIPMSWWTTREFQKCEDFEND